MSKSHEEIDRETLRLLGPARLAYFTPVREYPPLGDKKASTLLSVTAVMITCVSLFSSRLEMLLHGYDFLGWFTTVVLVSWFAVLLLCGWNAYVALTLPIPIPPLPDHEPQSLAFYKVIAATAPEDYEREVRGMSHGRALRDILHYNYSLATLSVAKFRAIQRSVRYLCIAFSLWIALMLLIAMCGKLHPEGHLPSKPSPGHAAPAHVGHGHS